ncbi:UDP-N-acetyl glucosamine 2-epimerase, partial [Pseudomonas aeruginosa]
MQKLKVVTVVGTRPEIIRLSRVMAKLDQYCDHVLVHTGQNYDYELNEIFFQDLGIRKPDYFLNAAGSSGAETIGNVIIAVDRVLGEIDPDALLVLGDTNSCMAVLPAKRRKIPTFHMEAGNRCFDMRVPEEINRRIVDHTADVNLTYSTIARDYLLREGLSPDMVIKTGSPMFEVLEHYRDGIESSDILERLGLKTERFFVVSAHREENIDSDKNFLKLVSMLNAVAEKYSLPVIVSTHPRTKKRIEATEAKFHEGIKLLKPLGFKDYNKLQITAKAVISD